MQEVILFYNGLEVLTRQILDSKGAIPTKTAADAKVAIQEVAKYSQKWHNGTSRTRRASVSVMPLSTYLNLGGGYRAAALKFYQRNDANPLYYIELNDLNVPLALKRDQVEDLMPTIEEEPFCKASCMEARRIDGLITIYNGNDNVTYQMARSHPRTFYTAYPSFWIRRIDCLSSLEKKSTKLVKYRSSGILCVL
nr:hypothetical protein [Tanacetum cinerariifolium]